MGRRVLLGLVVVVVSSCALPAVAGAKLPTFASKRIVLGKSIGGVRPGMSLAAAQQAWGPGGISEAGDPCQDSGRTSCIWKGSSIRERAIVGLDGNGIVQQVLIVGGPKSPLAKLKTSKGLGLGTKSSVLYKTYGAGIFPVGIGSPIGSGAAYILKKTTFFGGATSKRVIGVQIFKAT
jgi:hypothetical protein